METTKINYNGKIVDFVIDVSDEEIESNLKYLNKNTSKNHILLLKIVTVVLLVVGSVIKASIIWSIVDILVALMAIVNMYAVILLRRDVKRELIINKK